MEPVERRDEIRAACDCVGNDGVCEERDWGSGIVCGCDA